MNCGIYIENFLSAHVDGELTPEELRQAQQHLAGCPDCRARLAEERAVKALMRERAAMLRTPVQVRGSILAALDAADTSGRRRRADGDAPRRGGALAAIRRAARLWIPTALAAAAVFAFVMLRGGATPAHAVPAFDIAIDRYARFVNHFEPNVKSDSPADISDAYMVHKMPGILWNFQPSGYRLVGGRVEQTSDGRTVTFTFYRSATGAILCEFMKAPDFIPPPGARQVVGPHAYYEYNGYSICVSTTPRFGFICVLVSQRSINQFLHDVMASEY